HRMHAAGVDDEQDYLMRVQAWPDEMQQLIEAVVKPSAWMTCCPISWRAMLFPGWRRGFDD
ncbi:hypothetical protein CTI14_47640, partial [Methylobacterium radiotolerans]